MTGYQESVTDPSYAGQIIVFTYPLIGNYGVSAAAMESDRVHARGVVMRDAKNREDVASAEGGWLDWLGDCGVAGVSGVDTRALVRHIRDRGAMRGGVFPAETPEPEARERIDAEPAMDGADLARTVTPPEPVRFDGDGPHVVGIDTGIKMSIVRQLREHGCQADAAALRPAPPSRSWPRTPTSSSSPTGPATRRRSATSSRRSARSSARSRSSASASATSCSAAPSVSRPTSCPSATAAPTTRSRTWRPAGSTSPPRTTASRSPVPAASRGSRATIRSAGRPTSASPSSLSSTSTTAPSRAWSCATSPAPPSSTTPRRVRARTTPATCSSDSCRWLGDLASRKDACRVETTSRRSC